jgi:hypothetical protein
VFDRAALAVWGRCAGAPLSTRPPPGDEGGVTRASAGRPEPPPNLSPSSPAVAAPRSAAGSGSGRAVPRYFPGHVATELRRLLDDPSYAERASTVGAQVRAENGVKSACDALEGMLRGLQQQDLKCGGTSSVAA